MSTFTNSLSRSCHLTAATRSFTTSSIRSAIPPESPNYVDIPDSYQPDFIPARRPKGILPVPREIFPRNQPDKPSAQYLSRAIPPQQRSSRKPLSQLTPQEQYKSRMTTLRRAHLRSGLLELYNRKVTTTQAIVLKSSLRQSERTRLMHQSPRLDDRLTTPSTPTIMLSTPGAHASLPSSPSTHAVQVSNTTTHYESRAASRLDALHTLYMHARSFITTEPQLAVEIDRVFDNAEEQWQTNSRTGVNIWNREPPATVAALLQERTAGAASGSGPGKPDVRWKGGVLSRGGLGIERDKSERFRIDQRRMKRIAEELSGGKM